LRSTECVANKDYSEKKSNKHKKTHPRFVGDEPVEEVFKGAFFLEYFFEKKALLEEF
jgi:hypothetical protein